MKKPSKSEIIKNLPTPILFIVAILAVMYFLPRESKYQYTYVENTPWMYGLLTAPFNFDIQKSESQVAIEKDSILKSAQIYYLQNEETYKKYKSLLDQDFLVRDISQAYKRYISSKLETIYSTGILPVDDVESLNQQNKRQILLGIDKKPVVARSVSSFYTPKQAYEEIINSAPSTLEISTLKSMNLNNYLEPNVEYDEETTNKVKESKLREISLFEGEVISGQRIIDRGEIVTAKTKNILDSYTKTMGEKIGTKSKPGWLIVGQLILISLFFMSLMFYLKYYREDLYFNRRYVIFILLMTIILPIIASLMTDMKMYNQLYILPFAIPTILIRTFMDSRTAVVTHIITTLTVALMIPVESMAQFIIIQILAGYMCILSLRRLSERSQLVYCSLLIFATYVLSYTGWILSIEGNISSIFAGEVEDVYKGYKDIYIYFCLNFVLVSFAYILIYVFERIFGFISEVSMIELADTNKPLLRELSEVAPGTFQHSMQVSNLVVPAANKIGANAILVRTGALYHDIGKLKSPIFFTENQPEGINPHDNLSYHESARIIIGHVEEGVRLAKKHNLPQQIIDFIQTHHGTGKTNYFYNSYKNEHPDEEVDPTPFQYPGPNPFSKETAILMMADTVEAASRSLKDNSREAITALVHKLIDQQVAEGLMKNAPVTFKDIEDVKDVFCEKLISMRHARVAYPDLKKKEEDEQEIQEEKPESIK